ncbi:LacI family DNA-binding transcriptional regulator [Streptacidiphilus fuscans]|uniref:LacI family DNA-binding transcriptional regulator n=1 Tax=Streptacidiphilus fuscans TaxID=2789292 RepID=A0A931BD71_9ACTN|nr:LacI family DNA-binding transcriptional regulator [Streptacidiphilus fuscans]MBF9068987.1 LacI family DNA-binding transcriptional regulator [Streptacidiphilus fuscans]MBF9073441.1 LacI family DNA-binding transcriptional regulator [Streptacidiphilus fuscans]
MVTMKDVAERAGVTKQTVSNVITGRVHVSPATAARVRAAIDELGYTPNLVARSLATGSTRTVGLIVPTVTGSFYSELTEEVEDVLAVHGYHLLLGTTRLDGERAKQHLTGLTSRLVDALLVAGDVGLTEHLPVLADARFPVVLCAWEGEAPDTLPVVTIDYERAGFLAGRHLRELGHERVAVLGHPAHAPRIAGFRRAFAKDGITVPDRAVHFAPEPTPAGGIAAANAAFAADPDLTALFTTEDLLALGALEAARAAGRSVPDDLSVVGHDDTMEARQLSRPALTTVSLPKREMARQAIEVLMRAVTTSEAPTNALQLLRPTLIVRASTGPAAPAGRGQ